MNSCLYFGHVMHVRLSPVVHRFRYRVCSLLLDLDELPALHRRLRLFSVNRFNLFGFSDRGHGVDAHPGERTKAWAERTLREAGLPWTGGTIRLLCFPRMFGHVFNPLSEYFCHDSDGRLVAVIHEVHNTFGERHAYVLPVSEQDAARGTVTQACDKAFYVSPFVDMEMRYVFRIRPPGEAVSVLIREYGQEGEVLRATLSGRCRPLTDGMLLRALLSYPLMTLKIVLGIRWQALRLWRKGVKIRPHTPKQATAKDWSALPAAPSGDRLASAFRTAGRK